MPIRESLHVGYIWVAASKGTINLRTLNIRGQPSTASVPCMQIEIDGHGYVVTSLSIRYKVSGMRCVHASELALLLCCALTRNGLLPQLHKGKYVRDHSRLEVQPTGRYFLNMMLGESVPAGI